MSLFDWLFKNRPKEQGKYEGQFRLLNGYEPYFSNFHGEIYESELVRASINALATHISKLDVKTFGAAKPALQRKLAHGPNEFQTWTQFLARAATIYYNCNTLFITPVWDEFGEISGIYTPVPDRCELVQYNGTPYLRYEFSRGQKAAVELEYCGIMTRMQYKNDFFGDSNRALMPTMDLIHIQNQGIKEGVKSAATYRFMAQLSNFSKAEDLANERKRFTKENLSSDAKGGGLLLFPNTYSNIKQIESKPFTVDADQMKEIRANVFEYFGVNEDVLQNKFNSETWAAFYEGAIEPWAIQFSQVLTKMLFTFREQSQGNYVMATANRLAYMSNADKLAVSAQMADRGLMTRNEIREIWNLPPLPAPYGDQLPARGEYYNVNEVTDNGNQDDPGEA
jgi:hypothetical protein